MKKKLIQKILTVIVEVAKSANDLYLRRSGITEIFDNQTVTKEVAQPIIGIFLNFMGFIENVGRSYTWRDRITRNRNKLNFSAIH